MNTEPDEDLQSKREEISGEAQAFSTKFWWLNVIRGTVALLIGIGLLVQAELILNADRLQAMLFQFIGIYLLVSGIMSLMWGFSSRRRLGLWIIAGVLGLVGGVAFFLRSTLESYLSANVLTILFGLIMLLAGLIHVMGGFRLGDTYGKRWTRGHVLLGAIEIAIGILVLLSISLPIENLRIMLSFWGLIAGVGLIAEGLGMRNLKKELEQPR
jgi:uncharacterized membrane protein HdeD (DUF308 family)